VPQAILDSSLPAIGPNEFRLFRDLIHRHTGIWLREGKQVMLASRLSRRLRVHQLNSFADYYRYVETLPDNGVELGELINCVTTNKTAFFREPHHFRFLSETVVPEAMARARGDAAGKASLRIWSAACSTGEDPTRSRSPCSKRRAAGSGLLRHPRCTLSPPTSTLQFWKRPHAASTPATKPTTSIHPC
jgi:hypothetical protein